VAEKPFAERTEPATGKRRGEARGRGQVLRSQEVNIAFSLAVGVTVLGLSGTHLMGSLTGISRSIFGHPGDYELTAATLPSYFQGGVKVLGLMLFPIMLATFVSAIVSNVMQFGILFTTQPLNWNLDAINPLTGFKRIFSLRGGVELAKSLLKVTIVLAVAYWTLRGSLNEMLGTAHASLPETLAIARGLFFRVSLRIIGVFIVLAFLDWVYQRYEYEKGLRMTKQEVKQEQKETEGDPQVKGRVRLIQIKASRQRMMRAVKTADVVVTNPIHLAVALSYKPGEMEAPTVVAKGARLLAERIKTIARENGVPVLEDKPLARALYKAVEIGQTVPAALYRAVAEVLAFVYRLKGRRRA
jgi:flagellar biosynthesis protein FlhB